MSGSNTKRAEERARLPQDKKNKRIHRPFPVQAFMSSDELNILEDKWRKFGFSNRSDYIRFVLIHGVIDEVSVKFHVNAALAKAKARGVDKGVDIDEED